MNRFSRISQNFSGFLKNKLHHVCLLGNAFQQTKNEKNRNFERDRLMLDISGPSLLICIRSAMMIRERGRRKSDFMRDITDH